jgi:hypothetical protein
MRVRMAIIAVAIAMIAGTMACGFNGLLAREEATATPTKTAKPTFTVTSTATQTLVPTFTPPPTNTPTPLPPTDTPIILTATFTPLPPTATLAATDTSTPQPPTNTPRPTARPTRRPTRRPTARPTTPPQPTNTPRPQFAWRGEVINYFSNCGVTRLFGFTLDRAGNLAGDIWVHYWAPGWNGAWALSLWTEQKGESYSGDEWNWDGTVDNYAKAGTWLVCVVPEKDSWDCISETVTVVTVAEPCEAGTGTQVARIAFQQN